VGQIITAKFPIVAGAAQGDAPMPPRLAECARPRLAFATKRPDRRGVGTHGS
jgi:hypothetical protein